METIDFVRAASPIINRIGMAWYFRPETLARGKELGLDGFRFYFLGRGGVLGDVPAAVVASAFGYFNPTLLGAMWESASAKTPAPAAATAYLECAHALGRERLSDVEGIDVFCSAAEEIVAAADRAALPLFAGIAAQPLPDELGARAMHLLAVLREQRGSVHLVAVVASGLDHKTAHYLRRPNDFTSFGWTEADVPEVGDEQRQRLADADDRTDVLLVPSFAAAAGRADAVMAALEGMDTALSR